MGRFQTKQSGSSSNKAANGSRKQRQKLSLLSRCINLLFVLPVIVLGHRLWWSQYYIGTMPPTAAIPANIASAATTTTAGSATVGSPTMTPSMQPTWLATSSGTSSGTKEGKTPEEEASPQTIESNVDGHAEALKSSGSVESAGQ